MMFELQQRLEKQASLSKICVLGVDPGPMITGLQRLSPWVIRVLVFQIICPILVYLHPNGRIRPTRRSAADVLNAALVSQPSGSLKGAYLDTVKPTLTSAESRDEHKRRLVWAETVRLVGLRKEEVILDDWQ